MQLHLQDSFCSDGCSSPAMSETTQGPSFSWSSAATTGPAQQQDPAAAPWAAGSVGSGRSSILADIVASALQRQHEVSVGSVGPGSLGSLSLSQLPLPWSDESCRDDLAEPCSLPSTPLSATSWLHSRLLGAAAPHEARGFCCGSSPPAFIKLGSNNAALPESPRGGCRAAEPAATPGCRQQRLLQWLDAMEVDASNNSNNNNNPIAAE